MFAFIYLMGVIMTILMVSNYNCPKHCDDMGDAKVPGTILIGLFWWAAPAFILFTKIISKIEAAYISYRDLHETVKALKARTNHPY